MAAGSSDSPPFVRMTNTDDDCLRITRKLFVCLVCGNTEASNILSACLHTVCSKCIETLKESDGYLCQKCQENSEEVLMNELVCKMAYQNETPACEWCAVNEDTNISVGHCEQCGQWLCAECIKGHNRMPPFRSHVIKMVGGLMDKSLKCEIHPRESLELYCETCGVLTCRDCQLSVHRNHGGHRWVKEKADLLRPGLHCVVKALETEVTSLQNAGKLASEAPATLRASAMSAKAVYQSAVDALVNAVDANREEVEISLEAILAKHIQRLNQTQSFMNVLKNQIDYTLQFTRRILEQSDKDPASLVQLSKYIDTRLTKLKTRAACLATDNYNSTAAELAPYMGWRDSAASRVLSICNRKPEDLARLLAVVCWTLEQDEFESERHNSSTENLGGDEPPTTDEHLMECEHIGDHNCRRCLTAGGCAVCRGHGMLLMCSVCQRFFHPSCHLPCVHDWTTKSEGWRCSFCSFKPPWSSDLTLESPRRVRDTKPKHDEDSPETKKWTINQLEAGKCLLLNLLCHPEAVFFTSSSDCPICSQPMTESPSPESDPSCEIFHRIPTFRQCLEIAEDGESSESFDSWIRNIDLFAADIACFAEESKVSGASQLLSNAGGCLRDVLDASVETFYPTFFDP